MSVDFVDIPNQKQPSKRGWPRIFKSKKFWVAVSSFLLILSFIFGWAFLQYRGVRNDVSEIKAAVGKLKQAVEKQNLEEIKKQNSELKSKLIQTQKDLNRYSLVGKLPIVSGYYSDANHLLKAAIVGTDAAQIAAVVVEPFADVLGLQGHKSTTNAEQKAEIVIRQIIPELEPKVDQLAAKIKQIKAEIDQINVNRYPQSWKVENLKIRDLLVTAKKELATADALLPEVKPILQVLPEIAGSPTERNYLILFQNDKELRPTGGFITSYARAKIYGGRLVNIVSGDIQDLDQKIPKKDSVPEFLHKYLGVNDWTIHDANLSPDYRVSAEKVENFYYRIPKIPKIDGVIAIDTEFVRRLLTITGPLKSKKLNETFSAENNDKGIPDVVYKLELYTEKILANDPKHKGFIGELMNDVIDKVSAFPPDKFEPFLTTVYEAASEKHILFYFNEAQAQKLAEKYNFAARIKNYSGDYVHINNSNFAGLKGNLYTKFGIDQDIKIADDGTVTKTITASISNTGKADGWLNANYLNWQRLYVPEGSQLISQTTQKDFTEGQELGKGVFRSYSSTKPLSTTTSVYTYQLPFKVKKGEKYKILIQKQPGTGTIHNTIKVNGVLKKEFDQNKDQELEFSWD